MPDIFTEFGSFTVAESGALIFQVLAEKQQNDSERWYMIDNSLMTTMPDAWGINQRFILLPINKWGNEVQRANVGGLSCDQMDYYNSEIHANEVYLPVMDKNEPLYIGFFIRVLIRNQYPVMVELSIALFLHHNIFLLIKMQMVRCVILCLQINKRWKV